MVRHHKEPSSAPQTDSEEPTRIATRARNKNIHPGKEAGVVKRTRVEIQAEKAAKGAAQERARAEKEQKEAVAIENIAAIERRKEAEYALDKTPRCAVPQPQTRPSRSTGSNLSTQKGAPKAPHANSDSDLPSESGSSSADFSPEDETTEEDEATEGTATTDLDQPKKSRRKGKGRKEKRPIRTKISNAKETMEANGEENLETPRPASKRANKPAQFSVSTHF
jgi:hypothetical protein